MRKRVVFVADSLDNAYKFQRVLSELGVEIAAGSTLQVKRLLQPGLNNDLVVFEARGAARTFLKEINSLVESCGCPLLVIADESALGKLELPSLVMCDFVVNGADNAECAARVRRLLGETKAHAQVNVMKVGSMVINLDTYQVTGISLSMKSG